MASTEELVGIQPEEAINFEVILRTLDQRGVVPAESLLPNTPDTRAAFLYATESAILTALFKERIVDGGKALAALMKPVIGEAPKPDGRKRLNTVGGYSDVKDLVALTEERYAPYKDSSLFQDSTEVWRKAKDAHRNAFGRDFLEPEAYRSAADTMSAQRSENFPDYTTQGLENMSNRIHGMLEAHPGNSAWEGAFLDYTEFRKRLWTGEGIEEQTDFIEDRLTQNAWGGEYEFALRTIMVPVRFAEQVILNPKAEGQRAEEVSRMLTGIQAEKFPQLSALAA